MLLIMSARAKIIPRANGSTDKGIPSWALVGARSARASAGLGACRPLHPTTTGVPAQEQPRAEAHANVHLKREVIPVDEGAEDTSRPRRGVRPVNGLGVRGEGLNEPEKGQQRAIDKRSDAETPEARRRGDVVAYDREEQEERQVPAQFPPRGTGIEAECRAGGRHRDAPRLPERQDLRLGGEEPVVHPRGDGRNPAEQASGQGGELPDPEEDPGGQAHRHGAFPPGQLPVEQHPRSREEHQDGDADIEQEFVLRFHRPECPGRQAHHGEDTSLHGPAHEPRRRATKIRAPAVLTGHDG